MTGKRLRPHRAEAERTRGGVSDLCHSQKRLRPHRAADVRIRGEVSASARAGGGAPAPLKKVGLALLITLLLAVPAFAGERYALVVTGASGGEAFQQKYDRSRSVARNVARQRSYFC